MSVSGSGRVAMHGDCAASMHERRCPAANPSRTECTPVIVPVVPVARPDRPETIRRTSEQVGPNASKPRRDVSSLVLAVHLRVTCQITRQSSSVLSHDLINLSFVAASIQ